MFRRLAMSLGRALTGRNGPDNLFRVFTWTGAIILMIGAFMPNKWLFFTFYILGWLCVGYAVFRMLSRNVAKRRSENYKYLNLKAKIKGFFKRKKAQFRDRKTHSYKKCKHCKAVVRLPKKKGRHTVNCPKCKKDFQVKI